MGRTSNSGLSTGVKGQMNIGNYTLSGILSNQTKHHYILKDKISPHKLPMTGQLPNSTQIQRNEKGDIVRIRHYDINGNAYKDVDYTDHGRPDVHKVPHTHIIEIGNNVNRKKGVLPRGNRKIQQVSLR